MLLPEHTEQPEPIPIVESAPTLEERLQQLLSQIEGAGKVCILLTEDTGREILFQTNTQTSGDSRSEDTVLVASADRCETGLVRQIMEPVYRGAVVLCQGADRPSVKLAVVEAVRCVTGLGADAISVLKMK